MKTLIRRITYASRTDEFRIYPLPDVHLGNAECDEDAFDRWIAAVQNDDHALWVGMGDYCDFITRRDVRHDVRALAPWLHSEPDLVKAQRARLIKKLHPIAPKCIALLRGNHEDSILRLWERDVYGPFAEALESKPGELQLGYAGFVRLIFTRNEKDSWTLDIFLTHGWWGGRLQGNGALQLERLAGWVDAQVILAGHDHKAKAFTQVVLRPLKNGQIEQVQQICASCGTFLTNPLYAEAKGYRPRRPDWVVLSVIPNKRQIHVTI